MPDTLITIRPAAAADIDAIAAIYAHAVLNGTASYEYDPPSRAEMAARLDAVTGAGFDWLVATINGRVAGYAYASAFRPRPAYRFMVEDSVYVAADLHGRGVGRSLLTALITRLEAKDVRQVLAVIGDAQQNHASIRLHSAMGFAPCGRIAGSGFKHGRWLDTALMQLPLNGGAGSAPGV